MWIVLYLKRGCLQVLRCGLMRDTQGQGSEVRGLGWFIWCREQAARKHGMLI